MIAIIQLIGKYWYVAAIAGVMVVSFGYGYKVRGDRCDRDMRVANEMYQAQAAEQALEFESARSDIEKNRKKVVYAKNPAHGDCIIDANRLPRLNSALANDTSGIN